MKHLPTFLLSALCAASFAQEATPAAAEPETVIPNEAAVEEKSVRDMIDDYLAAKGWSEGRNEKGDSFFYAAVGISSIQAPLEERGYIDSRVNAYNKAMLKAKAQMAEFLEISIRTETEHSYAEGNIGGNEAAEADEMSISAKIKRLLVAKLDEALREEGIEPESADQAARERVAKKQLNSDVYSKLIRTAAKAEITGMQVCCSFEGVPRGKKGEIGVVAIWSPKLQSMASSLKTGCALPSVANGKKPIREQIPTDTMALLSTFGVQQKIDENGRMALIGFGQAGAVTDSSQSGVAAENKARLQAMAAIREFAGESVAVVTDCLNAETVEEFENAAEEYENVSAYSQKIKAVSEAMNISGIATVKRWNRKHPLTGKTVYGVVCSWSPLQAADAKGMKAAMDGKAPVSTTKPVAAPEASQPLLVDKTLSNAGADADDDAF